MEPVVRRPVPVAAVTAATLALLCLRVGFGPDLPAYLYLGAVGVVLGFIDAAIRRLPDPLTLPSYVVGAALLAVAVPFTDDGGVRFLNALTGMGGLLLLYAVQWFIWRSQIGLGDVKLAGVLGLYLGWLGLDAVVLGVFAIHVLGGLYALALVASRRAGRTSTMPFGPFMLAGTLIAVLVYA
jgi:prepilin signal peptidase PulO-like enzyme (type II secretory pathway)